MKLGKASGGGLVCGVRPRNIKRSRTSERDSTVRNASCNLLTIAAGVRAGATTIPHPAASKPGTPSSASGGISGVAGKRAAEVTPSNGTLPALICGRAGRGISKQQSDVAANHVRARRHAAFIRRPDWYRLARFVSENQSVKKGRLFLCPVCVPYDACSIVRDNNGQQLANYLYCGSVSLMPKRARAVGDVLPRLQRAMRSSV